MVAETGTVVAFRFGAHPQLSFMLPIRPNDRIFTAVGTNGRYHRAAAEYFVNDLQLKEIVELLGYGPW